MDAVLLEREVDANFEMFMKEVGGLLPARRGEYVLLRDRQIKGFFPNVSSALEAGRQRFDDGIYSVQEVTDRPADLGFFSHAVDSRIA